MAMLVRCVAGHGHGCSGALARTKAKSITLKASLKQRAVDSREHLTALSHLAFQGWAAVWYRSWPCIKLWPAAMLLGVR